MNRTALRLARQVADDTGTLRGENICNPTVYDPKDPATKDEVKAMYKVRKCNVTEKGIKKMQIYVVQIFLSK